MPIAVARWRGTGGDEFGAIAGQRRADREGGERRESRLQHAAREYASTTHCSAEVEADRSRLNRQTIVLSTATSRTLRQSTARTHH